jgi:hypothetical protein
MLYHFLRVLVVFYVVLVGYFISFFQVDFFQVEAKSAFVSIMFAFGICYSRAVVVPRKCLICTKARCPLVKGLTNRTLGLT